MIQFLRKNWYQLFKYAVYIALMLNVVLFLKREVAAAETRFADGFSWSNFIDAYTATMDTGAWFLLLILFELVTYIIPDKKLTGVTIWGIRALRGLAYFVILYSFTGYLSSYLWINGFEAVEPMELCELKGNEWMKEVDEFITIKSGNCETLMKGKQLFKYPEKSIFIDEVGRKDAYILALVDLINSMSWILVVILLEIDVWLQWRGRFTGWALATSKIAKRVLYAILIAASIYWGIFGQFLDFWDAFLWIVAFFFIEMNLFEWQKETEEAPLA